MSADPTGDWALWKWVAGMLGSMLAGAATSGWIARGMLEDLKRRLALCEHNFNSLKEAQVHCQANLKEDITQIVELAIANHTIASGERIDGILHAIKNLAATYDRRQTETVPTPHGEHQGSK